MRTTIDIDDALLAEAMEACGLKTKMASLEGCNPADAAPTADACFEARYARTSA